MNIKWILFLVLPLMSAMPKALAWRCAHGFANLGDTSKLVRKKCGPADFTYVDSGIYRSRRFWAVDERWYYNYGPSRLLHELRFRNGRLQSLDTLGYGFKIASRHCTPYDVRDGMSAYELLGRCGSPKRKRQRFTRLKGARSSSTNVMLHTEIWTYDFGRRYFLQKVIIAEGRVKEHLPVRRTQHHSRHRH